MPCDVGGAHFPKVEGLDDYQGSCVNSTGVNVSGSKYTGTSKGLSVQFKPCVGKEGNLLCQPESAIRSFFNGATFKVWSTGNSLNFEDANHRLGDVHEQVIDLKAAWQP